MNELALKDSRECVSVRPGPPAFKKKSIILPQNEFVPKRIVLINGLQSMCNALNEHVVRPLITTFITLFIKSDLSKVLSAFLYICNYLGTVTAVCGTPNTANCQENLLQIIS